MGFGTEIPRVLPHIDHKFYSFDTNIYLANTSILYLLPATFFLCLTFKFPHSLVLLLPPSPRHKSVVVRQAAAPGA